MALYKQIFLMKSFNEVFQKNICCNRDCKSSLCVSTSVWLDLMVKLQMTLVEIVYFYRIQVMFSFAVNL